MVVSWDFMGFYGIYPLVMTNITIENHHLKWNCPLNIVIFHSYANYQRVSGWIIPLTVTYPTYTQGYNILNKWDDP